MSAADLWQRLQVDGLVEGDHAIPDRIASPWFVRVMLGIAGWIGAFFLLASVGMAFVFVMENGVAAFLLGLACCGTALLLFRAFDGNDFAEQFGLAISLAGQVMIVIGLAQLLPTGEAPFYFVIAAAEALLLVAVPNLLHRALAAAGAALAFAMGMSLLSLHGLAAPILCLGLALIWLEPRLWAAGGSLWRPIGYGLVLALLLVETSGLFDQPGWWGMREGADAWMVRNGPWLGRGATAAILVWVAVRIAARESRDLASRTVLIAGAAAALFGLLALPAPGLASALLVLVLGFAAGNRPLAALGILALFGFVSHFYYSLASTLLEKSGLLAVTGLVLLAAYAALRRFHPAPAAEAEHA